MTRNYEITFDLPGATGGYLAEPRSYDYPENDTDTEGYYTQEAIEAQNAAQSELDEYVRVLSWEHGATNIRVNDEDLALNVPDMRKGEWLLASHCPSSPDVIVIL